MNELGFKTNDKVISASFRKYMVPTILSILATTVVSFINNMVVGQTLGKNELAAMNLGSTVTFIFAMLGCLIGIGGANVASVALGEHKKNTAGAVATLALVLAIAVPVFISVILIVFLDPFMSLMGARDWLRTIGKPYLTILIMGGAITTFMYYPFNFLRVAGKTNASLIMFGVLGVSDVAILILFLKLGFGLQGVGYTILISTFLADVVGLILLLKKGGEISLSRIENIGTLLKNIWTMGAAAGLNNLCNFLRTMCLNSLLMTYMGTYGVSVFAVACSVLNFVTAFVAGLGQSVSPMLSVFYGEKEFGSVKLLMKRAIKTSAILMAILFVMVSAASYPISEAFGMDRGAMCTGAAISIIWIMASLIPGAINNVFIFYFMSMKRNLIALILTFARAFGFVVMAAAILLKMNAGQFVYSAFLISEILTFLLLVLICWIVRKRHPEQKGLLLILDDNDNDKNVSMTVIADAEGASRASMMISDFGEAQELNPQIAMALNLSIEEMLLVMGEHCFDEKDEKVVDVRVAIGESDVMLRLRCCGKLFDPIHYYKEKQETMTPEELLMDDTLGIGMIVNSAKSVEFSRTLGLNNLIVRL